MSRENERFDIERRLRNARVRLRRATRDVEELEALLSEMAEQDSLDLIRGWRGEPDWASILHSCDATTMVMHMLGSYFLERTGLPSGHRWDDTKQRCLHVRVAHKDDPQEAAAHVERIRAAIERFAPYVLPHEDGLLWFIVDGRNIEGCQVELRISPDLSIAKIVRLCYSRIDEEIVCAGLGEALFHLQGSHPGSDVFASVTNPMHAPGQSGEALRLALVAFLDGCRSAGKPVDDFSDAVPAIAQEIYEGEPI